MTSVASSNTSLYTDHKSVSEVSTIVSVDRGVVIKTLKMYDEEYTKKLELGETIYKVAKEMDIDEESNPHDYMGASEL